MCSVIGGKTQPGTAAGATSVVRPITTPVVQPSLAPGGRTGGDSVSPVVMTSTLPSAPTPFSPTLGGTTAPLTVPATTVAPASATDLAGMVRRKKLAAMQAGILSTVNTPVGGPTESAVLSAPSASGTKTKLGQ